MITNGSQKQIDYANKIIATWTIQVNNVVDDAKDRVSRNTMPQQWLDTVQASADAFFTKLNATTQASRIIDARNVNCGDAVFNDASKNYTK